MHAVTLAGAVAPASVLRMLSQLAGAINHRHCIELGLRGAWISSLDTWSMSAQ